MRIHGAYGYSKEFRRAALPRRAAAGHRRGHQRDAAHHHRPPADRAEPGLKVRRMLPLSGMRVIAIEQYGAGPYGTMQLADLGAEVIKIENPSDGGDMSRRVGPFFSSPDDSHFFESFNRNKKSITLDLKQPTARARCCTRWSRDADGDARQSARRSAARRSGSLTRRSRRPIRASSARTCRPTAAPDRAPTGRATTI